MSPIAKIAVVTGGSRGIGAATVLDMAARGCDIALNFRSKESRAHEVADQVEALGRKCLVAQTDLTDPESLAAFAMQVRDGYGRVDYLILNAAGGLERDKDETYAYALNVTASVSLLDAFLPVMPNGSSVVYVTSHMSHFYGQQPVVAGYERVASTKKIAEDTLRQRIPELSRAGVRLAVVSGDLIEGTINAKLMQRGYPGLMSRREEEVGALPTVEEFSKGVADAATSADLPNGATILIGSVDWKTYEYLYQQEQKSGA